MHEIRQTTVAKITTMTTNIPSTKWMYNGCVYQPIHLIHANMFVYIPFHSTTLIALLLATAASPTAFVDYLFV